MSTTQGGRLRAAAGCAAAAAIVLCTGTAIGAERSGLSGGGSSSFKKGGSGKKMGEGALAPALAAPDTSAGDNDDSPMLRRARRLQTTQSQVAEQEAFMRTLRAHFVPGTWKPDQIADTTDNSTLLHYAVRKGFPEAVRYLLDQGANPLSRDLVGTTPLALAKELKFEAIVQMLEQAVANPKAAPK